MLRHRGTTKPGTDTSAIATAFERHLREVVIPSRAGAIATAESRNLLFSRGCHRSRDAWLGGKSYLKVLRIPYHDVLHDAEDIGRRLIQFLEISLNVEAMTRQVDASLHRNRTR